MYDSQTSTHRPDRFEIPDFRTPTTPVLDPRAFRSFLSPLFYPGAKNRFAADILPRVPVVPDRAWFVEPYCGSAILTLRMIIEGRANRVWLNDMDKSVTALWRVIANKKQAENLLGALWSFHMPPESVQRCESVVDRPDGYDPIEAALATIVVGATARDNGYRRCGRRTDLFHYWGNLPMLMGRVKTAANLLTSVECRITSIPALACVIG